MKDITDVDYAHAKKVCKDSDNLRTLEICVLKYMNLILKNFFQIQD